MSEKEKYTYNGPIWSFGRVVIEDSDFTTFAVSEKQALNNIKAQAAKKLGYDIRQGILLELDPECLINENELTIVNNTAIEKCDKCGTTLNDAGECPLCDLGDESVLDEKIIKKDSKWQVQSEAGKNLGTYATKEEAKKRLKQVEYFKHMNEAIESNTPYMLRNDGKFISCKPAHAYIRFYNKVDFKTNLDELLNLNYNSIKWFYTNTLNEETKRITNVFIASLLNNKELLNSLKHKENITKNLNNLVSELSLSLDTVEDDVESLYNELNDLTNEEFCRVRTSNIKAQYGGNNGEIYFRISSKNFNWFDLIWNVVAENMHFIKYVTIVRDEQTFGNAYDYYIIGGEKMKHIPVDEFLTLDGNPVVEELENDKIDKIDNFIEDLYDLRKSSIANEGEYSIGNLVFKEMRALGYLDNLKDLKNELLTKEMSLENLTESVLEEKKIMRSPTDEELKVLEELFIYANFEIVSRKRYDDEYDKSVHYQILSRFTVDDRKTVEEIVDWIFDTLDGWEEIYKSPSTASIGWQDDHKISAGIDCREIFEDPETKEKEQLNNIKIRTNNKEGE